MHKQEKNVREGLLWYWSLEALLNAGCGWSLPTVKRYHSCMLLLYFPFSLHWQVTGMNSWLQQTIKVLFLERTFILTLALQKTEYSRRQLLENCSEPLFCNGRWVGGCSCCNHVHGPRPYPKVIRDILAMTQVWSNKDNLGKLSLHKAKPDLNMTSILQWTEV